MTAVEVLNTLLKAGVKIIPGPDRHRVRVPVSLKPLVQEHREELRRLIGEHSRTLEAAYRKVWSLPESATRETVEAAYHDVVALESRIAPDISWWVLRETATAFHAETGICPFCQNRGDLHLPLDQLSMELRDGR